MTNMSFSFDIATVDQEDGSRAITATFIEDSEGSESVPAEMLRSLTGVVSNPYFQAYWLKARSTRRRRNGLEVNLSFRNGVLDLKKTFAEVI